jgi:MSHA biogenesis protein MshP
MCHSKKQLPLPNRQRGFLMPLAVFLIVVMGVMALAIGRNISQSTTSTVQAMVAIQAFYAADSGAQWGMNQLFYDTSAALTRAQVDGRCTALNGQTKAFAAAGLNNCDAQLSCSRAVDPTNTTSYYVVRSSADCGDATMTSQRSVEISAFMR